MIDYNIPYPFNQIDKVLGFCAICNEDLNIKEGQILSRYYSNCKNCECYIIMAEDYWNRNNKYYANIHLGMYKEYPNKYTNNNFVYIYDSRPNYANGIYKLTNINNHRYDLYKDLSVKHNTLKEIKNIIDKYNKLGILL